MSKIMRAMYAEARAAREAATPNISHSAVASLTATTAAGSSRSMVGCWSLPLSNPAVSARSTVAWWVNGIETARGQ
ncbi:MAG TPA: hypothetical protein VIY30_16970 [Burkholderiaceae bacterium]